MAALNTKNFSTLVQDQAAAIQGRARELIDFSIGSTLRALVESNGGVGLWLESLALKILAATRATTSFGADLDSFVEDWGVERLGAQSAVGAVTFSRFSAAAQAVIPVGATVQTVDGTQGFLVIADPSNTSYNAGLFGYVVPANVTSLSVPVRAVTPGALGNVQPNTIAAITSSIPYIDTVTNAAAMTGGGDAEDDAALRVRFKRFIAQLAKATPAAVVYAAQLQQMGLQVTITENYDTYGHWSPGYFYLGIDDGEGTPSDFLVTQVYKAVDIVRAAGVRFSVFKSTVAPVDVSLNVEVLPGFDANVVKGQVGLAIANYIKAIGLGNGLAYTKLAQIAYEASPGLKNATTIRLNGDVLDIAGAPLVTLKPATITVS